MVRGDKLWRGLALIILCTLVYYLSYDHGQQSMQVVLESYKLEVLAESEIQRQEVFRLSSALTQCRRLAFTGQSRDFTSQGQRRDIAPKVKNQDDTPQGQNQDTAPKVKNRDATLKVQSRDATPEGQSRDATPEGQSRNATPEVENSQADSVTEDDIFLREETMLRDEMSLRIDQSRILFDGRLVVTLLDLDITRNRAILQLNFIDEVRILTGELEVGKSFKFPLDGGQWALTVDEMSVSSAKMGLVEFKDED